MLNQSQIDDYREQGFLHVPEVFDDSELRDLSDEMNRLMKEWADRSQGWVGDWRKAYMDEETEKKSKLVAMHELQNYSTAWMRAVTHPRLAAVLAGVLGPNVEYHHSTMHVKPPQTGHPFPMHQDMPFYEHTDDRYVDVLVHLDNTCHENGEIRFLADSHKQGYLPHIKVSKDGSGATPHLPTDEYSLEDTVAVPAKAGDIVIFNINTIHGSYINTTDIDRRLVRVGYRHPNNVQIAGQNFGMPGFMMCGKREKQATDAKAEYAVTV